MSTPNVINLNSLDGRYITPAAVDTKIAAQATTEAAQYATQSQLATKVSTASLATVATSGSYNDLLNKPVVAPDLVTVLSKTASYATTSSDVTNTAFEFTASSAVTFTVSPDSTATGLAIGSIIEVAQTGTAQVTIAAGGGVSLRTSTSLTTRTQWSAVSLRKRAANDWIVSGDLL